MHNTRLRYFKDILLIFIFILISLMYGCSANQNSLTGNQTTSVQTTGAQTTKEQTSSAAQIPEDTTIKTLEEQLTEKLLKEEGVNSGQIYIQNNIVYCAINFKEDANTKNAKKLAQRYADELKETYKDKQVNVQAIQKGESIANILK